MRAFVLWTVFAFAVCGHAAASAEYRVVPGGTFVSALSLDGSGAPVKIAGFEMRPVPVSIGDYLVFIRAHPEWRRDRVSPLYADSGYLASWAGPLSAGPDVDLRQPVTEVSWFAARAFCAGENGRLPSWYQWEFAAAADDGRRDARDDPLRSERILHTLLARTGHAPGAAGAGRADIYGLYDMNALVWEWVDDYAAMFVNADARDPDRQNLLGFCGGAALAFDNRSAYALMMRVAALSAMGPADSSGNIGFRCVRDMQQGKQP